MSMTGSAISVLAAMMGSVPTGSSAEATPFIVAPSPVTPAQPIYPQHSLRLDEQGVVEASFWIEKSGQTSRCAVITSSGYPRLDQATCLAISKMTFASLKTEAIGPFLKKVRWQFEEPWDGNPTLVGLPHTTRGINKLLERELPTGRRSNVGVYLKVSGDGAVQQCKVRWGSENQKLDKKACDIASNWRYQPFLPTKGKAFKSKIETVFFADPSAHTNEGEALP